MIGIVAIGRNEGDRLRACLAAASAQRDATVVYVDSGSTDGSRELARSLGAHVVELDLATPFTAARARNEGFERLMRVSPQTQFVQFLDGDCELRPDWLDRAVAELTARPRAAVVCGRRRERFPDKSIYNQLCDLEWDTPIGETKACGGDALMRTEALRQVHGYNPAIIAGEEPELCVRLRQAGWQVWRIDAEMTLHDAAMTRFGQWWKRNLRAGHAYAEGAHLHGQPPERHWVKEVRSNWVWGLGIPLLAIMPAWWTYGLSLLLLALYPIQALRVYQYAAGRYPKKTARLYSLFIVLGKFPQVLGQLKYTLNRLTGNKSRIIEYKAAESNGGQPA
ncbi:MAG: glycosyltransferase [Burkholderiales bacterium]|nr:glycosyltransferase [Phycisphaerae bacterium]